MRQITIALFLLVTAFVGYAIYDHRDGFVDMFYSRAYGDSDTIRIGLAVPDESRFGDSMMLNGAQLAVQEINDNGGVASRLLELVIKHEKPQKGTGLVDQGMADVGRRVARQLVRANPIAVIGHGSSSGAIAASLIYQNSGVLYFSPYATNEALTSHELDLVFRLIPPNVAINDVMSRNASERGLCRMLILWERSEFGRESSLFFSERGQEHGIEMVYSTSFLSETVNFNDLLLLLLENGVFSIDTIDAIYLAGQERHIGRLVKQARKLGIAMPIFGSETMNSPEALELGGDAMNNTTTVSVYNRDNDDQQRIDFARDYEAAYGAPPTQWAAIAYDTVRLIVQAIKDSDSLDTSVVSDHLRTLQYTKPFEGVTGLITFDKSGEMVDKIIDIVEFKDGRHQTTERTSMIRENKNKPAAGGRQLCRKMLDFGALSP